MVEPGGSGGDENQPVEEAQHAFVKAGIDERRYDVGVGMFRCQVAVERPGLEPDVVMLDQILERLTFPALGLGSVQSEPKRRQSR